MKTIFKYPLVVTDEQKILMPVGAEILCVQMQRDIPCLWAEVNVEETRREYREIFIHGTGHKYNQHKRYIGTFQKFDGALVFHVFEGRSLGIDFRDNGQK